MKSLGPIAAVTFALAVAVPAMAQKDMSSGRSTASPMSAQDFVNQVADGTQFELQSARLATQKAQDKAVKRFAQRVIKDHTKVEKELKRVAKSDREVQYPNNPQMSADQQNQINQLQGASGKDFDKSFVDMMSSDHKDDVNLFQSYETSGDNPKLKAFARRTLPKIEQHLRSVDKIQSREKSS